jgi:hypothetical protein
MPETARQTDPRRRAKLGAQAQHARESVSAKGKPGEYLVCGRLAGGAKIWDVYFYVSETRTKLVGRDFIFQDEALAFIRDRKKGKIAVGWSGLKGRFKMSNRSKLIVPDFDIETRDEDAAGMVARELENGDLLV